MRFQNSLPQQIRCSHPIQPVSQLLNQQSNNQLLLSLPPNLNQPLRRYLQSQKT